VTAGLYVHVPFCRKKCDYCNFFSAEVFSSQLLDLYGDVICDEMKYRIGFHGVDSFDTLYFGGGTPSLLNIEKIKAIVSMAAPYLTNDAEVTMEINPEDVSREFLSYLKDCGINRVSMGLQSLNRDILKTIGRSTTENLEEKLHVLQDFSGLKKSIDLICGIPGQTIEDIKADIDAVAKQSIGHISLYALSIEEGTPLFERLKVDDSFEEFQRKHLEAVLKLLHDYGYNHYEISNFAREGCESRHNMKYWTWEPYIGLGAGAHSFVDNKRSYHNEDISLYLKQKGRSNIFNEGNQSEEIVEYIMTSLRMLKGFCLEDLERNLQVKIKDQLSGTIEALRRQNLLIVDIIQGKTSIRLSEEGVYLCDKVVYELVENFIP